MTSVNKVALVANMSGAVALRTPERDSAQNLED